MATIMRRSKKMDESNVIPLSKLTQKEPLKRTPAGDGRRSDAINESAVDALGLEAELKRTIQGEVRFDDGSRALYATDGSNYRQVPIGVVVPKSNEDVIATVAACRKFGAPLLSRGGGTSLAGQCCNVAVVMDFSKYLNKVLEIDPEKRLARVQPGCVLDDLRDAAAKYGLTFGPDPATHNHNTLGGMLGNDSCGVHSVMAVFEGEGARTADNTYSLDILLYDGTRMTVGATSEEELDKIIQQGDRRGEIYQKLRDLRDHYEAKIKEKYPDIPRRVSGYNLPYLLKEKKFNIARALVGSEGTCAVILEATLNLIPNPPARSLLLLGYPSVYEAGDHVLDIMAHKPTGCEGLDNLLVDYMKEQGLHPKNVSLLPPGNGWLMVEFGGKDKAESDGKAKKLMEELKHKDDCPSMKLFDDSHEEEMMWKVRESGLGATAHVPNKPTAWPGWEDSAIAPKNVGKYLRDLRKLFDKYGYGSTALYGHFGQGCIHCRIPFDLETADGIAAFRSFLKEAAELVVRYGGSCSGEHGDGQARAELLPIMFGDDLINAFREFKSIWDPAWRMNPGKVVDAYRVDENLRLGIHYNPWNPPTHFKFPDDKGGFAHAALRCVGVGLCRRHEGGTMCPSYMVTREEKDSTRGRARLLFEMLQGNPLKDGWKSSAVKDALDLCLACKGCKGDCPVHVDMATYKAEFLSHYYEGKIRPRHAYAFGLIHIWSSLVHTVPGLATLLNLITQTPGLGAIAKAMAGMEQTRRIPPFAPESFKQWWASRPVRNQGNPKVMLFADTFNDHFHVNTSKAAVQALEAAGFQVEVPMRNLCCGRPLYDYGFLGMAKDWLGNIMEALRPEIENGIPMVVLEPSCCAVFRDELTNLFPGDKDAQRLSQQTYLLSEFLQKRAKNWEPPKLERKALVHGHCHHKAIMSMQDEDALLKRMGIDYKQPEDGCCGMAGAFGFEEGDHYDVSVKCGERKLLPDVRDEAKDTLVIADGFSCREQISQCTDRHALHLSEVIQMALCEGREGAAGDYPENSYITSPNPVSGAQRALAGGLVALAAAAIVCKLIRDHATKG